LLHVENVLDAGLLEVAVRQGSDRIGGFLNVRSRDRLGADNDDFFQVGLLRVHAAGKKGGCQDRHCGAQETEQVL
jgi:hypothetical protein